MATPVLFQKGACFEDGRHGDFNCMIELEKYSNCLFLFNDNYKQRKSLIPGAGNACIRPAKAKHRAAGIPTGWCIDSGGFDTLGEYEEQAIDLAIYEIQRMNRIFKYDAIYYSADSSGRIGCGIFAVAQKVLQHITDRLINIFNYDERTPNEIEEIENALSRFYLKNYTNSSAEFKTHYSIQPSQPSQPSQSFPQRSAPVWKFKSGTSDDFNGFNSRKPFNKGMGKRKVQDGYNKYLHEGNSTGGYMKEKTLSKNCDSTSNSNNSHHSNSLWKDLPKLDANDKNRKIDEMQKTFKRNVYEIEGHSEQHEQHEQSSTESLKHRKLPILPIDYPVHPSQSVLGFMPAHVRNLYSL